MKQQLEDSSESCNSSKPSDAQVLPQVQEQTHANQIQPEDSDQDSSSSKNSTFTSSSDVTSSFSYDSEPSSDSSAEIVFQMMHRHNLIVNKRKREHSFYRSSAEQATIRHIAVNSWANRNAEEELEELALKENEQRLLVGEEGIFIFESRKKGQCCSGLPVDETVYLKKFEESRLNEIIRKELSVQHGQLEASSEPKKTEAWHYAQKIIVCDVQSLYLFHQSTKLRRVIMYIVENKVFDTFIILLILLNSIVLAAYDYDDRENCSQWNKFLNTSNNIFSVLFMMECALKIVAYGLINHYNAYLRDTWNWLDFSVVIVSIIEFTSIDALQLKPLRTLRVLRPLRSIKALPGMKKLIVSLIKSLPNLGQAIFFCTMIFILFGILGIQQYAGVFYQRCRTTPEPVLTSLGWIWPYDKTVDRLCTLDGSGMYTCPVGQTCGTPKMVDLPLQSDRPEQQALINFGITTFDNILFGFMTIFQMVTLEGWSNIMYNLMDASIPWMAILICVVLVILCAFFMLNVILAVIADSISDDGELEDKTTLLKNEAISRSIKHAVKLKKEKESEQKVNETKKSMASAAKSNRRMSRRLSVKIQHNPKEASKEPRSNQVNSLQQSKQASQSENSHHLEQTKQNPEEAQEVQGAHQQEERLKVSRRMSRRIDASRRHSFETNIEQLRNAAENENSNLIAETTKKVKEEREELLKQATLDANKLSIPHNQKNKCFSCSYSIVANPVFNLLVILIITANIIVLAMDRFDQPPEEIKVLEWINTVFEVCFLAEMIIKLFGLGIKEYSRDNYNLLDALLVIASLVDIIMKSAGMDGFGALTQLRGIRLLRVLKLARSWTALRDLLRWFGIAFHEAGNFVVLACIFVYIFMLMGMEFYAFSIKFDKDSNPIPKDSPKKEGGSPRANFDTPANALTTIFIVMVGDDWNFVMYDHFRGEKITNGKNGILSMMTIVFFVVLYIMMNLMMLNLLLAILLKSHSSKPTEDQVIKEAEEEEKNEEIGPIYICMHFAKLRIQKWMAKICCCLYQSKEATQSEDEEQEYHKAFNVVSTEKRQSMMKLEVTEGEQSQPTLLENSNFDLGMTDNKVVSRVGTMQTQSNMITMNDGNEQKQLSIHVAKTDEPLLAMQISRQIQRQQEEKKKTRLFNRLKTITLVSLPELKLRENALNSQKSMRSSLKEIQLQGKSLFLFSRNNWLRLFFSRIVSHPIFDNLILVLIFGNTFLLCLEKPLDDPNSPFQKGLHRIDQVLTGCFLVECCMKIIVYGFLCNGPNSYLLSTWNIADFLIALISSAVYLPLSNSYEFVKVIRIVRVLKPLRMVKRYPGIRIAVESIIQSVPQFINLQLISFLVLLMFSVLGITFFKGLFYTCHNDNIPETMRDSVSTKWDCFDSGGEWITRPDNFDDVFKAMMTLFTAVTTEGWVSIMWQGVDVTRMNVVPKAENRKEYILYFVLFIILGSNIILNLFVGVVVDTNAREKRKILKTHHLTTLQVEYTDTLTKAYSSRPQGVYVSIGNPLKDTLHVVAVSKFFDRFIFTCIIVNTITMAATWYDEPKRYKAIMETFELIFAIIYTLEAFILITVYGKIYFKDGWRVFDFLIVLSAGISWVFDVLFQISVGPFSTVLRSFRILRVLKMVKRFKSLYKIFNTFIAALTDLVNVGSLLLLFLVVYAELGVYLFSKVKLQTALNQYANFQNFGFAMLTLFRMTTGEAWNEIMWDCRRQRSILFQCDEGEQTFAKISTVGIQGCGAQGLGGFYFVSFITFGVFIITNMFISIIMDGYNTSNEEEKMHVNDDTIEQFKEIWMKYDPNGTGLIDVDLFENLVIDLIFEELKMVKKAGKQDHDFEFNAGFSIRQNRWLLLLAKQKHELDKDSKIMKDLKKAEKQERLRKEWRNFVKQLYLPTYKKLKFYNFHDTIGALIKYGFAIRHQREFIRRIDRISTARETGVWLSKWDKMKEDSPVFQSIPLIDQEKFLEISRPDFNLLVSRIETKALRTGNEEIHKLKLMKERRRDADGPYSKILDVFCDDRGFQTVIDSSKLIGGRVIANWILKERRQVKFYRQVQSLIIRSSQLPLIGQLGEAKEAVNESDHKNKNARRSTVFDSVQLAKYKKEVEENIIFKEVELKRLEEESLSSSQSQSKSSFVFKRNPSLSKASPSDPQQTSKESSIFPTYRLDVSVATPLSKGNKVSNFSQNADEKANDKIQQKKTNVTLAEHERSNNNIKTDFNPTTPENNNADTSVKIAFKDESTIFDKDCSSQKSAVKIQQSLKSQQNENSISDQLGSQIREEITEEEADKMPFLEPETYFQPAKQTSKLLKKQFLPRSYSGENEPEEDGAGGTRACSNMPSSVMQKQKKNRSPIKSNQTLEGKYRSPVFIPEPTVTSILKNQVILGGHITQPEFFKRILVQKQHMEKEQSNNLKRSTETKVMDMYNPMADYSMYEPRKRTQSSQRMQRFKSPEQSYEKDIMLSSTAAIYTHKMLLGEDLTPKKSISTSYHSPHTKRHPSQRMASESLEMKASKLILQQIRRTDKGIEDQIYSVASVKNILSQTQRTKWSSPHSRAATASRRSNRQQIYYAEANLKIQRQQKKKKEIQRPSVDSWKERGYNNNNSQPKYKHLKPDLQPYAEQAQWRKAALRSKPSSEEKTGRLRTEESSRSHQSYFN